MASARWDSAPTNWKDDLTPIEPSDRTRERAAHLLERTGFGGTPREVDALAAMAPQAAVRQLVRWQERGGFEPLGLLGKDRSVQAGRAARPTRPVGRDPAPPAVSRSVSH